jgi:hypothetical protein
MTSRLDQRFAALKRDGRSALVACVMVLSFATLPQTAAAQSESALHDLGLSLVEDATIVDCPAPIASSDYQTFTCVGLPLTRQTEVVASFFRQLSEHRWVRTTNIGASYWYARWISADCIEQLGLAMDETGLLPQPEGQRLLVVAHRQVCGALNQGAGQ